MNDPITGEIRMAAFDTIPDGWAVCDGRLLPISEHRALYQVIGSRYGGDGRRTFALPDLRDRVALHTDGDYPLGATGGEAAHTLTVAELPAHRHLLPAAADGSSQAAGNAPAMSGSAGYGAARSMVTLAGSGEIGAAAGHSNMQPYLGLVFIIALDGRPPAGG